MDFNMNLNDIIIRKTPPEPWEEGDKIPWDEPGFSRRMLDMHLSQDNDWASRRFELVNGHVDWIEDNLLKQDSRILDLGCGPGLYTQRLAKRGYRCVGVDFSPASIEYAVEQAMSDRLEIDYQHADVRSIDFGGGFGLVMMIFGEFNVFRPEEAENIVSKAWAALDDGGVLLLECHTFEEVERQGKAPAWWQSEKAGLFSDRPHIWLQEHFWDAERAVATTRYFIVMTGSGKVTRYASTMQAYSDAKYVELLERNRFRNVEIITSISDIKGDFENKLQMVTAEK